jgi:hypothetical protein
VEFEYGRGIGGETSGYQGPGPVRDKPVLRLVRIRTRPKKRDPDPVAAIQTVE